MMEPRKRPEWTPRLRRWVVKQALEGLTPISEIARNRCVSRRSIYMLLDRYAKGGFENLEPQFRGRRQASINKTFEQLVFKEYLEFPKGCHKMWLELITQGYGVSQRQIQHIYNKNNFKMNTRKRPKQLKFTKYEWPTPNSLWHTDWTECPFTGMQLIAFIDDHSRFVVHAEYFNNQTTENTVLAFQAAMKKHGKPENILTDNGVQFHKSGAFEEFCEQNSINHIFGRPHHPQTNGKIERWFGTYKLEFQPNRWNLDQYVELYNNKRLHQGIGYTYPAQRYLKTKCAIKSV
jgi:putative transposase